MDRKEFEQEILKIRRSALPKSMRENDWKENFEPILK